jgi:hypothetical protein
MMAQNLRGCLPQWFAGSCLSFAVRPHQIPQGPTQTVSRDHSSEVQEIRVCRLSPGLVKSGGTGLSFDFAGSLMTPRTTRWS